MAAPELLARVGARRHHLRSLRGPRNGARPWLRAARGVTSGSLQHMTTLDRARDIRVSGGSAIRHRRRPVGLLGLAVRTLIIGIALGTVAGAGWAVTPASAMELGATALAWLLLSFESDQPDGR
jgi:hypothetical protein